MGMFDGLVGGIVGAGMVTVVNGILEKHGGLQGVINQFEQNGPGAHRAIVGEHRPESARSRPTI